MFENFVEALSTKRFAEINVQRLLMANFETQKDPFGGHIVFLLSEERGHVAALLTLKAK